MHFLRYLLAAIVAAAGLAQAGTTNIAQVPLLNLTGTGSVKPNIMLLYDNSGSMGWQYTPDFVDDSGSCRSRSTLALGSTGCTWGHPPFHSSDFNRQYYNPKLTYTPPLRSDGTSYDSMDAAHTSNWTAVLTDGYGIDRSNLTGSTVSSSNLVTGFPDRWWCLATDTSQCVYNAASYMYPNDSYYYTQNNSTYVRGTSPYYYNINVSEYCSDRNLSTCVVVPVGSAAPAGYPYPAKVRYCTTKSLTTCQAKYITGKYIYPRFGPPSGYVAGYGTVTIGASSSSNSLSISSVSVDEAGTPVVITNGAVTASTGTNSLAKQNALATSLAASIKAKSGLTNQYTACVSGPTPSGAADDCSIYGITLGATNVVAVIPLSCPGGATSKSQCTVLADGSRSGWSLTAVAPASAVPASPATAVIAVSGTTSSKKSSSPTLSDVTFNGSNLLVSSLSLGRSTGASSVASKIVTAIGVHGTVGAYLGGNSISTACAAVSSSSVCLVDTSRASVTASVGSVTSNSGGSTSFAVTTYASTTAMSDGIPVTTAALSAGSAVFSRVDIVSSRDSYPKADARSDCAGASCTYAEEMTNFGNWYAYYKSRNQMMKTAVGRAFQPINGNYRVGIVSLSAAASGGAMTVPKDFTGTDRDTWYTTLYGMSLSGSTPMRQALHAVGKMYANLSPYAYGAGDEVVQYPCQQNFTFVTTDGYWNGSAAADVLSNDQTESATRFCTRLAGCVDTRSQSTNSLADVALYWYNGGSNNSTSSLRTGLEDWTKPTGMVPAAAGENTRLHMNTYTLGLGVDGIMTYEANYDSSPTVGGDFYNLITGASSGCPWNSNGAYVWPDPQVSSSTSTVQERVDDLWHAAVNGHGKYFSAADPQEVVTGLNAALSNIQVKIGAAAAAATSTPNISQQDNDIFSDTFTTVKWYGELTDRKIDTVTGVVGSTPVWSTSNTLGMQVGASSDTRVIKMLDTSGGGLKDFSYASLSAQEKTWFDNKCLDLAQCTALGASDRALANDGTNVVNWLRGQQQYANDAIFRAYALTSTTPSGASGPIPIVLGDIASAKPAYLREPRKAYTMAGYASYKTTWASRQPTVFAAANDGMLHAFKAGASDHGEEMWAYVPRITMSKLYKQLSTTYGTNHQFTVDGSPEIADVQIGGEWRTVLVAGLNAGGRGYYALDVTDPTAPQALWEVCADAAVCGGDDRFGNLGLTFGNPQFGQWRDGGGTLHWVVLITSGYNNVSGTDGVTDSGARTSNGGGYLYILDVADGSILARVATGAGDSGTPSGLARITAITSNPNTDPLITYVYGGDVLGKMWRFDFTAGGTPTVTLMGDAGTLQPITARPEVTQCRVDTRDADGNVVSSAAQKVVVYGTGRLLDVPDLSTTEVQSIYVLKDSATTVTPWRDASVMQRQALSSAGTSAAPAWAVTGAEADLSTLAGWYMDLDQNSGERVNLDPKVVSGTLNVVTNIPSSSSACSVGGTSNVYSLRVCTGSAIDNDNVVGSVLSNTSAAVGFIIVRLPSGALKMITTTADGNTITSGVKPSNPQGSRKVGWRRVTN